MAEPVDKPVTIPELFTTATDGLLLDHTPPDAGISVVVVPGQIEVDPVTMACLPTIVTGLDGSELQPGWLKTKVTIPSVNAVTTPLLLTVAIDGSELTQVPPEVGDNVVVAPIQMTEGPVILAAGQNNSGVGSLLLVGSPSLSGSVKMPFCDTSEY